MHIFIPTYGRSDKQVTYNFLPKKLQDNVLLVVQHREYKEGLYSRFHQRQLLVLPDSIRTVSPSRQYIMKWAHKQGISKLVMLDDDMRFDTRRGDEPTKFLVSDHDDVMELFDTIARTLDDYAHVGVLAREGGNRITETYVHATRMTRVLAYCVEIFMAEKIKFDRLPLQEDFDVTLQLLRKGYANAVLCNWVHGQGTSNAPGGCSHFRTDELHDANPAKLAALHPGFVKVVTKTTKGAWGGRERKDVTVQWKKAYLSSKE